MAIIKGANVLKATLSAALFLALSLSHSSKSERYYFPKTKLLNTSQNP